MYPNNFLYPRSHYRGRFTPQNLILNANLQEFSHRVNYICNLGSNGKLSLEQSYQELEALWSDFEASQDQIGMNSPDQ